MKIAIVGTTVDSMLSRKLLLRHCVEQGHTVYVFCMDHTAHSEKKIRELGAVPQHCNIDRSGLNPFSALKTMIGLSMIFRELKIDTLLAYQPKPIAIATLAGFFAGVKSRFSLFVGLGWAFTKRPEPDTIKQRVVRWVQLATYHFALRLSKVLFLNEDDPKTLQAYGIPLHNSVVVPGNGVSDEMLQYKQPNKSRLRIVFIGRLLIDKGVRELFSAIEKLRDSEVYWDLCGDVDSANPASLDRDVVADFVAKNPQVTWHKHTSDVVAIIDEASLLILPTYREGMPRVVPEAMARGRAVIVTDVPGARSSIIDTEHGLIIQPYSDEAIVSAIKSLLSHPERIHEMGCDAFEYARVHYRAVDAAKSIYMQLENAQKKSVLHESP